MALFWFICGILLICGIARYNESNNCFCTLMVSFLGAFTAASVIIAMCNDEHKENVVANVSPTQLYVSTQPSLLCAMDATYNTTYDVPTSTSVTVSKDYYISNDILPCSRVSNLNDKPPQNKQLCYNISTLLKLSKLHLIKNSSWTFLKFPF